MRVLGIETATTAVSVALVEDKSLLSQILVRHPRQNTSTLVQDISYLMRSSRIEGQDLDGIAVSIGPGSYTGLRVGLSVGKSLAFCWGQPLVAVNSLDAFAQIGRAQERSICALIRFRKGEYYYALYKWNGASVEKQSNYQTGKLDDILACFNQPTLVLGLSDRLDPTENYRGNINNDHILSDLVPEAKWTAFLGESTLSKGISEDISSITPFYMHEFPIDSAS